MLVSPEPRDIVIGSRVAAHRLANSDAMVLRVPPRLQPQPSIEQRMMECCDIARCIDVCRAAAAQFIDHNAAFQRQAGIFGQCKIALHADASNHYVGVEFAAATADHVQSARSGILDRIDNHPEMQCHAGIAMQRLNEMSTLG